MHAHTCRFLLSDVLLSHLAVGLWRQIVLKSSRKGTQNRTAALERGIRIWTRTKTRMKVMSHLPASAIGWFITFTVLNFQDESLPSCSLKTKLFNTEKKNKKLFYIFPKRHNYISKSFLKKNFDFFYSQKNSFDVDFWSRFSLSSLCFER